MLSPFLPSNKFLSWQTGAIPRRRDPFADLQSSGRKGMDVGSLLLLLGFALLAGVVAAVCWAVLS